MIQVSGPYNCSSASLIPLPPPRGIYSFCLSRFRLAHRLYLVSVALAVVRLPSWTLSPTRTSASTASSHRVLTPGTFPSNVPSTPRSFELNYLDSSAYAYYDHPSPVSPSSTLFSVQIEPPFTDDVDAWSTSTTLDIPSFASAPPTFTPSISLVLPPDVQAFLTGPLTDPSPKIQQWLRLLSHPEHTIRIETAPGSALHGLPAFIGGYPPFSDLPAPDAASSPSPTSTSETLQSSLPDGPLDELSCKWDGCRKHFCSARFSDIEAHLREDHFGPPSSSSQPPATHVPHATRSGARVPAPAPTAEWYPGSRGRCRWAGCQSERTLFYKSFAKHIASTHLRSTKIACSEGCGEYFTRPDSMMRHRQTVHGAKEG
ncbi:uncharacterized protein FIBRA_08994 [Fibroporia radiculosa]|uniref:C2H2-type domain-containing protein n=1 Tax=Fibroporia radiculosa TaxID=599839 RepID=J4GXR6_9APHY|nr:uncharacterized protein FIBRA_08994 [Fibroporia radiculosa]CCM06705.1 predicted protein [Fibroporia radiculosa]